MIKSEEGVVEIHGKKGDLTLEFMNLYEDMIKYAPEIVAAVILNHEQELADAVSSTEAELIHVADTVVKAANIVRKEKNK